MVFGVDVVGTLNEMVKTVEGARISSVVGMEVPVLVTLLQRALALGPQQLLSRLLGSS
jgi:predicted membrane-bound spermidine synthase